MADRADMSEFLAGFLAEADEHLASVNANLVAVEEGLRHRRNSPRPIRELFRSLHTLKGLASMVGADPIADLAHELEALLRDADARGGAISEGGLDALVHGVRALEERLRAMAQGAAPAPAPPAILEALAAARQAPARQPVAVADLPPGLSEDVVAHLGPAEREQVVQALAAGRRVVELEFLPSRELADRGLNVTSVRERLSKIGELVKVVPRSVPGSPTGIGFGLLLITDRNAAEVASAGGIDPSAIHASVEPPAPPAEVLEDVEQEAAAEARGHVRVTTERLDEALERLSALVVTRFRLGRAAARLGERGADVRELSSVLQENALQLRDLRAAIMQIRMVSLSEMLQRVPLIVRGLTRGQPKAVAVSIRAGRAEVDKSVAERLFPPVVHLVRNAVVHGLETREERAALHKPEEGSLEIACSESSGQFLLLDVSDDGRGIDVSELARRAGRPVPDTGNGLVDLLATPGLSTRDEADLQSGRGMGMDIVKRSVEQLGGGISVCTRPGEGTRFTLRVPLSITIVDAFSFAAGEDVFVAPVSMVEEIIEVDPAKLVPAPAPSGRALAGAMLRHHGEAVPLVPLRGALQLCGDSGARPPKALLVRHGGMPVAFGVDRLVGQQEVVVRPLEDPLVKVRAVAGATDLGDGRPVLVLDLVALGASLSQRSAA